MAKYYDWDETMSYQTGTNGEICLVCGAKDIGKTFGLRLKCVRRFIKYDELFCEICRTNEEKKRVMPGYFDKLQSAGFFENYVFKCEGGVGYISEKPKSEKEKPNWRLLCYFVSLTNFQTEKKRTFVSPKRYIFDEAIIDVKDRYHRYLKDEFLILANLLDTISRQQPGGENYYVYLLGNAVNMTCPYFQHLGINKIPEFGYSYYKNKTVLLHYVEPWDSDERKANTLVGRMLAGDEESAVIFDNEFQDVTNGEIAKKTSNSRYSFAFKWGKMTFAFWRDHKTSLWYVTKKLPKDASNVYTLTRSDSSINYQVVQKADGLAKLVKELYYLRLLRYDSAHLRECFFEVLAFLGVN